MSVTEPTRKRKNDTCRSILAAATAEFSEKGFAGARMDEIARRASVNKATIYYHIGDKSALYLTVLHDVFSNVADRMEKRINRVTTPEAKLAQYVHTIADNMKRNPSIPSIMLREIASGGENLPNDIVADFARMFQLLAGVLDEGIRTGIFRKVSPLVIHFSALGPLVLLNRMESKIQYYTQETDMLPETIRFPDNIVDTIAETIVNSVLKK